MSKPEEYPDKGIWRVAWANPTKPRPDGWPETMLRVEVPLKKNQGAGVCPVDIDECWQEVRQYGYSVFWHRETPPARRLPLETKWRIRRRNLWKRYLQRYPMFLETFYREAVEGKPDYYGPYTAGEFADIAFARTTMGNLKMVRKEES